MQKKLQQALKWWDAQCFHTPDFLLMLTNSLQENTLSIFSSCIVFSETLSTCFPAFLYRDAFLNEGQSRVLLWNAAVKWYWGASCSHVLNLQIKRFFSSQLQILQTKPGIWESSRALSFSLFVPRNKGLAGRIGRSGTPACPIVSIALHGLAPGMTDWSLVSDAQENPAHSLLAMEALQC